MVIASLIVVLQGGCAHTPPPSSLTPVPNPDYPEWNDRLDPRLLKLRCDADDGVACAQLARILKYDRGLIRDYQIEGSTPEDIKRREELAAATRRGMTELDRRADAMYSRAFSLLTRQCERDAAACGTLGGWYERGDDWVRLSLNEAERWYGRACNKGSGWSCRRRQRVRALLRHSQKNGVSSLSRESLVHVGGSA